MRKNKKKRKKSKKKWVEVEVEVKVKKMGKERREKKERPDCERGLERKERPTKTGKVQLGNSLKPKKTEK